MTLVELDRALRKLRLSGMADVLETRLRHAQTERLPPLDLMVTLVSDELRRREDRLLARRHKLASFRDPDRSPENFDFDFNKKMNRALIFDLATARFVQQREDARLATKARLARIGVTIGQLAESSPRPVERLLGRRAVGSKLTALAWNRDPRHIQTRPRAHSAGAQSALGRRPAVEQVFKPTLHHLADRIGARLRAKSLASRTITVRVRFADVRSVTRSLTLPAPISATRALAEVAEDLVRSVLADHRDERTLSLLAISVSHLEAHAIVQLELPLGLAGEERRPGTKNGLARSRADQAVDAIRKRFGGNAVDYGSGSRVVLAVPDEFRRLAEREL